MVVTKKIQFRTKGNSDVIDITNAVAEVVAGSKLKSGTTTVFVAHSTAGVTAIECEPGLIHDFKNMFERLAPNDTRYEHDAGSGEGNGHAHVRASLLGPSISVPVADGRLLLGTWQQIVMVDFDNRPRERQVIIQVLGE